MAGTGSGIGRHLLVSSARGLAVCVCRDRGPPCHPGPTLCSAETVPTARATARASRPLIDDLAQGLQARTSRCHFVDQRPCTVPYLVGHRARALVEVVPCEPQRVPAVADQRVLLASIGTEPLWIHMPRPTVYLDRNLLRREREVDAPRPEGVAEDPAGDAGIAQDAHQEPLGGRVRTVGRGDQ